MKKILRESDLRRMVRECIHNFINESFVINEAAGDYTTDIKKKLTKYLEDKLNNGDEKTVSLFRDMGYDMNYNINQRQNDRGRIFTKEEGISQEMADDVIKVSNILSKYTDDKGNVCLMRDVDKEKMQGRDTRRYVEDDYKGQDLIFIRRMKDFLDMKGLTYLYDKNANMGTHKYGMETKDSDTSNLDFNNITKKEIDTYIGDKEMAPWEAEFAMKQKLVDDYMKFKYGMKLEVPNVGFSNGNKKLPSSTLIINFDSAVGCPAWNECIVKHACYARGTEKQRNTVYNANKSRTLMWRATKDDPEFMNLLMQFIRSYCVDFEKAANEIIKLKLTKVRGKNKLMEMLSTTPFSDSFFTPEIIEILKKYKRINNIRLNENGDFIGQWLVDAWDREAGEFKIIDINTSAYTCRHLNYEGIKNIILNTSFISSKGKIARHFIAVPENIYNQLDETYMGENNQLTINDGNVLPNYQPLFDINTKKPNGRVYYKCPCDRKVKGEKINCYQCQVCYNPNTNPEQTIVFVKAHGSGAKALSRDSINSVGISKGMLSSPEYNLKNEAYAPKSNNTSMAERLGIKTVTNNAIKSLYDKLG